MPTATSAASQALPRGLRIRRRRWPVWPTAAAIIGAGIAVGSILSGTSPMAILGAVAVLLAIGAAVYRLALGLAVLAFTYPFDLTTKLGPLKLTTSALLMGILVAVWAVKVLRAERPTWIHTPLDGQVLFFAGATALSLLGSGGYLQDELVGLAKAAGGFLVFFIVTQGIEERRDIWIVVGAVVATGVLQAGGLTLQVLAGNQVISEESRASGTVIDANLFAGYLVLVLPLAIVAGVAVRSGWSAVPTGLAVLALTVAIIATLSRSGWLGAVVSVTVLIILLRKYRLQLLLMAGCIAAILTICGILTPIANRLGPHADGPMEMLASRWNVWVAAVQIFIHHPVFGIGIANFQNYYLEYDPQDPGLNHAHNLVLNVGAERGVIGLATFGWLLTRLFRRLVTVAVRRQLSSDRLIEGGLLAAFAGYAAHSLLEVSYYDYKVLLLFWLLVGLSGTVLRLLSDARLEPSERTRERSALEPRQTSDSAAGLAN